MAILFEYQKFPVVLINNFTIIAFHKIISFDPLNTRRHCCRFQDKRGGTRVEPKLIRVAEAYSFVISVRNCL